MQECYLKFWSNVPRTHKSSCSYLDGIVFVQYPIDWQNDKIKFIFLQSASTSWPSSELLGAYSAPYYTHLLSTAIHIVQSRRLHRHHHYHHYYHHHHQQQQQQKHNHHIVVIIIIIAASSSSDLPLHAHIVCAYVLRTDKTTSLQDDL